MRTLILILVMVSACAIEGPDLGDTEQLMDTDDTEGGGDDYCPPGDTWCMPTSPGSAVWCQRIENWFAPACNSTPYEPIAATGTAAYMAGFCLASPGDPYCEPSWGTCELDWYGNIDWTSCSPTDDGVPPWECHQDQQGNTLWHLCQFAGPSLRTTWLIMFRRGMSLRFVPLCVRSGDC